MKTYTRYKDSGISWIGKIPEHWDVKRNKIFLDEHDDTVGSRFSDFKLLSLTKQGVILRDVESGKGKFPKDFESYKIVKKGNMIFCLFDVDETPRTVGLSALDGMITGAYDVFSLRKIDARFYSYFFIAVDDRKALRPLYTGLRKVVKKDRFLSYKIPVPPLEEQRSIAAYLDKKIEQINELVAAKQKQIELLKEYKQSLIANAVTKGINPKTKMKDSGISWIGNVPEHWQFMRAKYMFKKEKRDVRNNDEVVTCFRDGEVTLRKNRRTTGFTESLTEIGYQGIRKNDLVIHQMDAFAGAIGVSDSDGKGTSVYHCCTPLGNYNVFYYAFLLRVMAKKGFIQSLYRGIRERSSDFNFLVFGKQYLAIPPIDEQKQIVAYINERVSSIDSQISSIEKQIANLNEYKQSLISDVVTGKVKV